MIKQEELENVSINNTMTKQVVTKIKTEKELNILRNNAKVHAYVFEMIKKHAKPWVSTWEIDELCFNICTKYNLKCAFHGMYGFPGNICISLNACVVHGVPKKHLIFQEGDIAKFDFWVMDPSTGLMTDAAFTMIIWQGPHDKKMIHFLETCKQALYRWIAKATVGNRIGDISASIQQHVEQNGYHIVKELTWHAIGTHLHELPFIPNFWKQHTGELLKENMTLAIEPIIGFSSGKIKQKRWSFEIYIADGSPWCQFEHTIVVKSWYPEILI